MNNNYGKSYLISLDASIASREYVLTSSEVKVGRDAEHCDIIVAGLTISREHALIKIERPSHHNVFSLIDLNSLNGIYVNGKNVTKKQILKDGDLIGLGTPEVNHFCFQTISRKHLSWSVQLQAQDYWSIGRSSDNEICMPFESIVSNYHAILKNKKGQLMIFDNNSLNGFWVNGKQSRKTNIYESDTVIIGSTYFNFKLNTDGSLDVNRREKGDDIQLDCINITFVPGTAKKNSKKILDNISLSVKPGEFVGILGPSGAGKSTLLKILNGYLQPTSGAVMLNDASLHHSYDMFRNVIGYVPQDDILHQELTVQKSLEYIAKLRLPHDLTTEERDNIINSTVETLGLSKVRHNIIENLSGGQRKRVSIGAELLTKPSILYLDEPTSGLDPSVEEKLMRHFKKMALNGTTILITTHILYSLDLLDRIVILSQGRVVFFGAPNDALAFFSSGNNTLRTPIQIFDLLEHSPVILASKEGNESVDPKYETAKHYSSQYTRSNHYIENIEQIQTPFAKKLAKQRNTTHQLSHFNIASFLKKTLSVSIFKDLIPSKRFFTLASRQFYLRLWSLQKMLFYFLIPVALALITLSQNIPGITDEQSIREKKIVLASQLSTISPQNSQTLQTILSPPSKQINHKTLAETLFSLKNEGIQNLPIPMSVMIMCVMTAVFLGTISTCLEVSTEKSIYLRERKSTLRSVDYLIAKLPVIFLITFFQCCLFLSVLYLNTNIRGIPLLLSGPTLIYVAWSSACLGLLVSAADPTHGQVSVILAIAIVLPQLILSGGLGPDYYNGMNNYSKIIANILPAKWGLEMILTSIFQHTQINSTCWIPTFVRDTIGFNFGNKVLLKGAFALTLQALCWLFLSSCIIKRKG